MEVTKESKRRTIEGVVVSNKMQGTVKVAIEAKMSHPIYKKVIARKKFFMAHTDREIAEGEKVTIKECRPYSKNVRWVVL